MRRTFGNQASGAVDTCGVELDELEILKGKSSTNDHRVSITRACVRTGAAEVGSAVPTGGENGFVGTETMKRSVFHVHGNDTNTFPILHDQIESKVLDEEVGVVSERLTIK